MVETRPPERQGDASVAVLLTWFLPGAGHAYIGRVGFGVLAFVLVEGLYLLGWVLSSGRTFEYLDPELRGALATLLTPEAGNLGAMLWQLQVSGFGSSEPLPFPKWIELGSVLCAVSGILNLFLASHACVAARKGKAVRIVQHPAFLALATWVCPGLGHILQGRRRRGAMVFTVLVVLFALGTFCAAGTNLSRERHFYYWSGQFLLGGPAVIAEGLSGYPSVDRELSFLDVGLLYACMAGLLNVLAMLDVFGVAESRRLAVQSEASAAALSKSPAQDALA
jgi:TM2 domain-containing membrane protein YozV